MGRLRRILLVTGLVLGTLPITAPSASAVVCIEEKPGGCCEDIVVAGKTIVQIDCQN